MEKKSQNRFLRGIKIFLNKYDFYTTYAENQNYKKTAFQVTLET